MLELVANVLTIDILQLLDNFSQGPDFLLLQEMLK